jgi:hypothetical protein
VVNQFGQSWSVKNLFVTDGGTFASHPNKNPTLSILALSWRAASISWTKRGKEICEVRPRLDYQPPNDAAMARFGHGRCTRSPAVRSICP